MGKFKAKWISLDSGTLQANGDDIQVKLDNDTLSAGANGLYIKTVSGSVITPGTIADNAFTNVFVKADGTMSDGSSVLSGDLNFNSTYKVTGLATPTVASDAATKAYVDARDSGVDPKESVKGTTTADISGTYSSSGGTGGTGAFTAVDLTDNTVFDNVPLSAGAYGIGDRILLKNQSDAKENGIYVVTTAGATGAIERATDQDGSPSGEVSSGNYCFVEQGTANENAGFTLQGNGILTLNTDDLNWVQFSGAGQITAGAGLTKSGNELSVNVDGTTIQINGSDNLELVNNSITVAPGDGIASETSVALGGTLNLSAVVADFAGTGLEDDGSNNLRIAAAAAGNGLTGGAGSALAVGAGNGITVNANDVAVNPAELLSGGNAEIDADQLYVGFTPTVGYSDPSNDHLSGHLAAIASALNSAGTGDGNVSAATNFTDNVLLKGIGGTTHVEETTLTIDDSNNLFAPANVDVGGTLSAVGATTLDSTLTVGGAATFASTVSAAGAVDFDSTLVVDGNVTAGANINVSGNVVVDGQAYSIDNNLGTVAGAVAVDWDNGNVQRMTVSGDVTLTVSNENGGGTYFLIVEQDATGGHSITSYPTSWRFPGDVSPTLTTAANGYNIFTGGYDSVDSKFHVAVSNDEAIDAEDIENGGLLATGVQPETYTPVTSATAGQVNPATDSDDLAAHLIGIDNAIAAVSANATGETFTAEYRALSAADQTTGYFTLAGANPVNASSVRITPDGGPLLVNAALNTTGQTADFEVSGASNNIIIFRDAVAGGETLSDLITSGDILMIHYES